MATQDDINAVGVTPDEAKSEIKAALQGIHNRVTTLEGAGGGGGLWSVLVDTELASNQASFQQALPAGSLMAKFELRLRSTGLGDIDDVMCNVGTTGTPDVSLGFYYSVMEYTNQIGPDSLPGDQEWIFGQMPADSATPGMYGLLEGELPFYTDNRYKDFATRGYIVHGTGANDTVLFKCGGLYVNAAALDVIEFHPASGGDFLAGSRFRILVA